MLRVAAAVAGMFSGAAAAAPASIAPVNLRASFRSGSALRLEWGLALPADAAGFNHSQASYQLRTRCGDAPPRLIDGVGSAPRHVASAESLGIIPHASCAFAVRVGDSGGRLSEFSPEAAFPSLPAEFAPVSRKMTAGIWAASSKHPSRNLADRRGSPSPRRRRTRRRRSSARLSARAPPRSRPSCLCQASVTTSSR